MRSIKTKLFSLAMAVSMVLALAGCAMSAPSTVGSIGGVALPAGIYLLAQYNSYNTASGVAELATGETASDVKAVLKATCTGTINGEDVTAVGSDYVAQLTTHAIEYYAAVEKQFAEQNGVLDDTATAEAATRLFKEIYAALPLPPGEPEPMMNIFGSYYDNNWVITVIPRKRHRPWQYEAEGNDHLLSSPGAADIGGLFITPLEKDFKKINPELLRDVYQQVCLSDRDVEEIFVHLSSN